MTSKKLKAEERAERARIAMEEQRRRQRHRNAVRGGIVVVALALVVAVAVVVGQHHTTKADPVLATADTGYGLVVGPDTAAHKVVIYEDFICPICGMLESASHDKLAAEAAAGSIQVDYRPFNLLGFNGSTFDETSYTARATAAFSVVLDKSGADVAKKFHDILYANQPSEEGPFPTDDTLVAQAVQAGASEDDVKDAIESNAGMAWVHGATDAATKADVHSTPTVFVDGKQLTNFTTMDDLATKLEALGSA